VLFLFVQVLFFSRPLTNLVLQQAEVPGHLRLLIFELVFELVLQLAYLDGVLI